MSITRFVSGFCVLLLSISPIIVDAKEVSLQYKGVMLNAKLELAEGKTIQDGVILITHGGLGHRAMETITYIQSLLTETGHNTLAINLSLGIDNRTGMYDCNITHRHRHHDAVDEIDAWVKWLKRRGVKQLVLLGHSRGGGQTALYAVERAPSLLKTVILLAPQTRDNGGAGYQQRYNKPISPILNKAKKLIENGKGTTVIKQIDMLFCRETSVTAEAFVSYYGPDPRLDTPTLLHDIKKPTLVIVAGSDNIVVGLDKKLTRLVEKRHIQMKVIQGADHFFRDLFSDEAIDAINIFLENVNR